MTLEIEELYIVNLKKKMSGKNESQLRDVKLQKQKQFWNWDAKRSPKTTSPHIYCTYWPYQVDLMCRCMCMCTFMGKY